MSKLKIKIDIAKMLTSTIQQSIIAVNVSFSKYRFVINYTTKETSPCFLRSQIKIPRMKMNVFIQICSNNSLFRKFQSSRCFQSQKIIKISNLTESYKGDILKKKQQKGILRTWVRLYTSPLVVEWAVMKFDMMNLKSRYIWSVTHSLYA